MSLPYIPWLFVIAIVLQLGLGLLLWRSIRKRKRKLAARQKPEYFPKINFEQDQS